MLAPNNSRFVGRAMPDKLHSRGKTNVFFSISFCSLYPTISFHDLSTFLIRGMNSAMIMRSAAVNSLKLIPGPSGMLSSAV